MMIFYDLDTTHACFYPVPKIIHPSLNSAYAQSSHLDCVIRLIY